MTFEQFLSRYFPNAKQHGSEFVDACPVCEATASKGHHLYISEGTKHPFVLDCKHGCSFDSICKAKGISKEVISSMRSNAAKQTRPQASQDEKVYTIEAARAMAPKSYRFEREHIYLRADSTEFGRKLIYSKITNGEKKKTALWFRPNSTQFYCGLNGEKAPLYNLPALIKDHTSTIYLPEGEKDANTFINSNRLATTLPNGGNQASWQEDFNILKDRDVIVITDNDATGVAYGESIKTHLPNAIIVAANEIYPDAEDKFDITDIAEKIGIDSALQRIDDIVASKRIGVNVHQASEVSHNDNSLADIAKSILKPLSEIEEQGKQYLFKPYFPMRKNTLVSADPGTGKTKFMCGVTACVTTGNPLLGIRCERPGNVLIFSAEDDPEDLLKTIRACGGDPSKVTIPYNISLLPERLQFTSSLIEEMIRQVRPVLVWFDPIQNYLPKGVDMNRLNDTAAALLPIQMLADKYDFALVNVCHNNKMEIDLVRRVSGSYGFVGNARSVLSVVRDPEHIKDQENLVIHTKSNNKTGDTIRYRIESIPGDEDYARVAFLDLEDYSAADYMRKSKIHAGKLDNGETTLTPSNPVVKTIMTLLKENPNGVSISYDDFKSAKEELTGSLVSIPVATEIRKVSSWLNEVYGIGVDAKGNGRLIPYYLKGKLHTPLLNTARRVVIKRNRILNQDQQAINLD